MPSPTAANPAPEWRPCFNPWLVAASVMLANFRFVALLCLACVPLVFFFKKAKPGGGPVMAH